MHELDITRTIIRETEKQVAEKGVPTLVKIRLGALTTYKKDPILFYFEAMKDSSKLADAELDIEEVEGRARCKTCQKEFEVSEYWDIACPDCKSKDFKIISGEDVEIMEIVYE